MAAAVRPSPRATAAQPSPAKASPTTPLAAASPTAIAPKATLAVAAAKTCAAGGAPAGRVHADGKRRAGTDASGRRPLGDLSASDRNVRRNAPS